MFKANRFPLSSFRSWRFLLRATGASAGGVGLAVFVFLSIHHGPYAAAAESGPLASNVVRMSSDLNWRQSPVSSLTSAGQNSVTLDPCPPGVVASEPWYYVYISGTGTPEAVRVTGGTCKGDGRRGTLEFASKGSHAAGYVVGSASSGVQEGSARESSPPAPSFPR